MRPLRGRVLIEREKYQELKRDGLIVPQTCAAVLGRQQGRVLDVGAGVEKVAPGDFIIFDRWTEGSVIMEEEVLAIMTEGRVAE